MRVELVWQRDCPNVSAARANLMQALTQAGAPVRWDEWCVDDDGCPGHAHRFGSPTVLVDGADVAGVEPGTEERCRVYDDGTGALVGVPPTETIARALREHHSVAGADTTSGRFGWRGVGAMLPSIGVAFLPKVACPACWPAYAGVLSSLGVSFLVDTWYLFAFTAAFLVVALFMLGFRARRRRGYGPLALGALSSTVLLVGKFYFESDPAMYGALGLLVAASLWNSWPRRQAASPACSACEPTPQVPSCCDTTTTRTTTPTPLRGSAPQGVTS